MKTYKSHKTVQAAKIMEVLGANITDQTTTFEVEAGDIITIPNRLLPPGGAARAIGGYGGRYPDGHASWSPAAASEEGYTEVPRDAAEEVQQASNHWGEPDHLAAVRFRAEALTKAIGAFGGTEDADAIVRAAKTFEAYLKGE